MWYSRLGGLANQRRGEDNMNLGHLLHRYSLHRVTIEQSRPWIVHQNVSDFAICLASCHPGPVRKCLRDQRQWVLRLPQGQNCHDHWLLCPMVSVCLINHPQTRPIGDLLWQWEALSRRSTFYEFTGCKPCTGMVHNHNYTSWFTDALWSYHWSLLSTMI